MQSWFSSSKLLKFNFFWKVNLILLREILHEKTYVSYIQPLHLSMSCSRFPSKECEGEGKITFAPILGHIWMLIPYNSSILFHIPYKGGSSGIAVEYVYYVNLQLVLNTHTHIKLSWLTVSIRTQKIIILNNYSQVHTSTHTLNKGKVTPQLNYSVTSNVVSKWPQHCIWLKSHGPNSLSTWLGRHKGKSLKYGLIQLNQAKL